MIAELAAILTIGQTAAQGPVYADVAARQSTLRTLRAYDRLSRIHFEVTEGGNRREVWVSGNRARERSSRIEWAYDGTNLTIIDRQRKHFYQGPIKRIQVTTALGSLNWQVNPTLRDLWIGRNPVRRYFFPTANISRAGTMTLQGVPVTVLVAERPGIKMTLMSRNADGMLTRLRSEVREPNGGRLAVTERAFRYRSIRRPIPNSTFRLARPAGFTTRPLSGLLR